MCVMPMAAHCASSYPQFTNEQLVCYGENKLQNYSTRLEPLHCTAFYTVFIPTVCQRVMVVVSFMEVFYIVYQ